MKKSHVPVLVVGAGAAGTMLTLELARRGVGARTIDRLPKAGETSKAITVHARTLEIVERIDKRLVNRFLDRGIHNKGYVLHFVDGSGKRTEVRPGIDFTTVDSRYSYILVHRQSETEQFLREYASEEYAVDPDWGTTCVGVRQDETGVTATLEKGGPSGDGKFLRLEGDRQNEMELSAERIPVDPKKSYLLGCWFRYQQNMGNVRVGWRITDANGKEINNYSGNGNFQGDRWNYAVQRFGRGNNSSSFTDNAAFIEPYVTFSGRCDLQGMFVTEIEPEVGD